jgi:hypothetical protein
VGAEAVITATADRVNEIIAGDTTLLSELHRFLQAADIDNDLVAFLDELATAVAACSPFKDETDLIASVKRETLLSLHALALRVLPAKGNA